MISAKHIDLFQQTMLQNRGIALSEGVATDLSSRHRQLVIDGIAKGATD